MDCLIDVVRSNEVRELLILFSRSEDLNNETKCTLFPAGIVRSERRSNLIATNGRRVGVGGGFRVQRLRLQAADQSRSRKKRGESRTCPDLPTIFAMLRASVRFREGNLHKRKSRVNRGIKGSRTERIRVQTRVYSISLGRPPLRLSPSGISNHAVPCK